MQNSRLLLISLVSWSSAKANFLNIPNIGTNFKQKIISDGYPLEIHRVVTDDGYGLELQRIPFGVKSAGKSPKNKPVVLMISGFISSAADWVVMGPERGLGYILADRGYDVWLGNNRGTTWSRKHVNLNPDTDKKAYWDFGMHELGYYDLPALIDYVLAIAKQRKLFYVGYSQGTLQYFIMNSVKPEYNNKIRLATAIAPVFYVDYLTLPIIRVLYYFINVIQILFQMLNIYEVLPHTPLITYLGRYLCNDNSPIQDLCEVLLLTIGGGGSTQLNKTALPMIFNNFPAGASIKQLFHAAQFHRSKMPAQYDYGENENMRKYGQATPPKYDLSKVTTPTALFYGDKDPYCILENVNRTRAELPNIVENRLIQTYNHIDVVWGKNVVDDLYKDILKLMERY